MQGQHQKNTLHYQCLKTCDKVKKYKNYLSQINSINTPTAVDVAANIKRSLNIERQSKKQL